MSTYLWVDLATVIVPFFFSFHPRIRFHRQWGALWPAALGMMGLFIPWDALFTSSGIWGFNPEHVLGFSPLGLPIEEWLFFLCIPYACLFTYHCFQVLGVKDHFGRSARGISIVLVLFLISVALFNWQRAYTCTAWTLCALWIMFTAFIQRAPWLGRFYFTYMVLLVPFLVVNGILTGTGLDNEVVWYSDAGILGIRILTIPVEDVFYGMLMVGLTVSLYEAVLTQRCVQRQA